MQTLLNMGPLKFGSQKGTLPYVTVICLTKNRAMLQLRWRRDYITASQTLGEASFENKNIFLTEVLRSRLQSLEEQ